MLFSMTNETKKDCSLIRKARLLQSGDIFVVVEYIIIFKYITVIYKNKLLLFITKIFIPTNDDV